MESYKIVYSPKELYLLEEFRYYSERSLNNHFVDKKTFLRIQRLLQELFSKENNVDLFIR